VSAVIVASGPAFLALRFAGAACRRQVPSMSPAMISMSRPSRQRRTAAMSVKTQSGWPYISSGERRGGNPPKVSNPMTGQPVPCRSITRDKNRDKNMVVSPGGHCLESLR
jgi:hypothetical protein